MSTDISEQIQTIEEISLNALPCLQQILYDGWVLRFAEGYTKRANSVNPLYPGKKDLTTKIKRCEDIYRDYNLPSIFRLTNEPRLKTLDRTLDELGYQKWGDVSVQVIEMGSLNFASRNLVTLKAELSEEWLDCYVHAANLPIQHWNTLSTMLEIIPNPNLTCYGLLKNRHSFASCGLGVVENNYLGLFFIVTTPKQQRQGYASQLISTMLQWGRERGVTRAYVQVEIKNQAALNLYNKLGFTEVYQYYYRQQLL